MAVSYGETIRRTRAALGYTQEELAIICSTTSNTVSRWERDVVSPTGSTKATLDMFIDLCKNQKFADGAYYIKKAMGELNQELLYKFAFSSMLGTIERFYTASNSKNIVDCAQNAKTAQDLICSIMHAMLDICIIEQEEHNAEHIKLRIYNILAANQRDLGDIKDVHTDTISTSENINAKAYSYFGSILSLLEQIESISEDSTLREVRIELERLGFQEQGMEKETTTASG
jgi:transcriptional regulator with XRE-family HTH domain